MLNSSVQYTNISKFLNSIQIFVGKKLQRKKKKPQKNLQKNKPINTNKQKLERGHGNLVINYANNSPMKGLSSPSTTETIWCSKPGNFLFHLFLLSYQELVCMGKLVTSITHNPMFSPLSNTLLGPRHLTKAFSCSSKILAFSVPLAG